MSEIKSSYLQVKNLRPIQRGEFEKRCGLSSFFHCGLLCKWPVVFVFNYNLGK
jgi:hypothetical protein